MFSLPDKARAFTLIEISIVLVIIGLMVGGVLYGQTLIRASSNRSYIAQLEKYNSAVGAFKTKYECLPGDCPNATKFNLTGNGDGNGFVTGIITEPSWSGADSRINTSDGFSSVYATLTPEITNMWLHLRQSNLVVENFSAPYVLDGSQNVTLPVAKNDNTGLVLTAWNGNHYYRSGVIATRGGGDVIFKLNFAPADAAYIHSKLDGGKITTSNSYASLMPDDLGRRVLISGWTNDSGGYDLRFWKFQSQGNGNGGANDYCIDTSITPAYFNVKTTSRYAR